MIPKTFLFVIYICYMIYGWTASLLGSVWPKMSADIGIDISLLGILVMINYIASGIASFCTYKIRKKIGTNYTNQLALGLMTAGLIIFAFAKNFPMLVVAMPLLGFGSGLVDINSNSYVVKAYSAKWVSYLHACWGLGATIGPMVLSFAMLRYSYHRGYIWTAIIILICIIILNYLKRNWATKKYEYDKEQVEMHAVTQDEEGSKRNILDVIKEKNVLSILLCFFFANGVGCALSAWIPTIAVGQNGITVEQGVITASVYFFALMAGRIILGTLTSRISISKLIMFCMCLNIVGVVLYYLRINSLPFIYSHAAILGFSAGPLIPLLNSNLKEIFDDKILSELISLGGVFGLTGIAIISAIMTFASKIVGINNVQIVPLVGLKLLLVLYIKVISNINIKK